MHSPIYEFAIAVIPDGELLKWPEHVVDSSINFQAAVEIANKHKTSGATVRVFHSNTLSTLWQESDRDATAAGSQDKSAANSNSTKTGAAVPSHKSFARSALDAAKRLVLREKK